MTKPCLIDIVYFTDESLKTVTYLRLSLLNSPFCIFSGIFGDFQLLFQRPMAGTPPAYLRALSSRVELHFTRNHDPGQSGAGQRAVASKYLHL